MFKIFEVNFAGDILTIEFKGNYSNIFRKLQKAFEFSDSKSQRPVPILKRIMFSVDF